MIEAIAWRVAPSGHFVVYALTAHGRILVRVDQPLPNGGWVTLSDWLEAAATWRRSPEEWVEAHKRRGSRGGAVIAQHSLSDIARAVLAIRKDMHEFAFAAWRRTEGRYGKPDSGEAARELAKAFLTSEDAVP